MQWYLFYVHLTRNLNFHSIFSGQCAVPSNCFFISWKGIEQIIMIYSNEISFFINLLFKRQTIFECLFLVYHEWPKLFKYATLVLLASFKNWLRIKYFTQSSFLIVFRVIQKQNPSFPLLYISLRKCFNSRTFNNVFVFWNFPHTSDIF